MRSRPCPLLVAAAALALCVAASEARAEEASWATAQAAELTRQGKEHAARGDVDVASRRFMDAIVLDATFGPAYLALGELRERTGDAREGERAYSLGIDHVPGFAEGLAARARLRARQQRWVEARADLEAAASLRPDDVDLLRQLEDAHVTLHALPAALAVARRIEALLAERGDARASSEARVRARAMSLLVAELDPVHAGATSRGAVRRALAQLIGRKRPAPAAATGGGVR